MDIEQNNREKPNFDIKKITSSMQNIFVGLNKSTKGGIFELNEASQLSSDLNSIAINMNSLIEMLEKHKLITIINKETKKDPTSEIISAK
jgi:hypothetical protein